MVGLLGLVISRREISTYTGQHSTERKDKQPCLGLDSNARSHCPKIRPTPYTTLLMEVVVYLLVFRNPYVIQNFHCQIRNQWYIMHKGQQISSRKLKKG